jgi:glycosyltransferase involved in cell wall biosynthesis
VPLIGICIATHRRPCGLQRLLAGLNRLELAPLGDKNVLIVVVDNAADRSAQPVVDAFRHVSRFDIVYGVEVRRGEAFARNTGVAMAAQCSHLAFIDDDEEPDPRWLKVLYDCHCRTGAEIVCGAVERLFPDPVPPEVVPHLQRGRRPLGLVDLDRLTVVGGAGNLLVGAEVARAFGGMPFPEQQALSGGTDSEFLIRARLRGYRVVGASDAVVREHVPPERVRRRRILLRKFSNGHVQMHRMRRHRRGTWQPSLLLCKAVAGVAGWSSVGLACWWDRRRAFAALVRVAIHSGRIAGYFGAPAVQHYRTTDGS